MKSLMVAVLVGLSPMAALSQDKSPVKPVNGWYGTLGGGVVVPSSPSGYFTIDEFKNNGFQTQTTAPSLEAGIGYDFGKLRAEFTYGYTPIPASMLYAANSRVSASAPLSSNYNINSFLFGAYYDIENKSRWTPYFGGAIGPGVANIPGFNSVIDGDYYVMSPTSATVFAYQAKAGIAYTASKNADVFVEAGYLGTSSLNMTITQGPEPGSTVSPFTYGANGGFLAKVGVRYRFGK